MQNHDLKTYVKRVRGADGHSFKGFGFVIIRSVSSAEMTIRTF